MANRMEEPKFLRILVYILANYLRSPKPSKQFLHNTTNKPWWCTFIPCIFQLSSQMVDYRCCHILNTPETKVPVHLCLWSLQNAQQREDKSDHPPPTSSISQQQGWLCVWRQARRDTGKAVTVINVLPPECDINICMQCVHNIRYLCTTLINTMFDSSFPKALNELEEHAMRQFLALLWKKEISLY